MTYLFQELELLKINGQPAIKAATENGKNILGNIRDYILGNTADKTNLNYLTYVADSKCWVINQKVVLFNVAETEEISDKAITLVKNFGKNKPITSEPVEPVEPVNFEPIKINTDQPIAPEFEIEIETKIETEQKADPEPLPLPVENKKPTRRVKKSKTPD